MEGVFLFYVGWCGRGRNLLFSHQLPSVPPPVPLTLRSMLSSQVSLVFEGLPVRGWSTMQVGPCSALAVEEK